MTTPESTQLAKSTGAALAQFGDRDPIKELAARLRLMMPNAQKLNDQESMAVAQVAYAHDLDPFNGEVWGIKSETAWYGVMVGIKGIRKGAKREAKAENSTYWISSTEQVDPAKYGVNKPGAVAYEVTICDSATLRAYTQSIKDLTSSGASFVEARQMIGEPPAAVGIGIADPSERSKMGLHQRAIKRAEADGLKKRYSLEFRGAITSIDESPAMDATPADYGKVIEGEVQDIDEVFPPEPTQPEPQPISDAEREFLEACETTRGVDGAKYGTLSDAELQKVITSPAAPADKKSAAEKIINWRKAKEAKLLKDVGF